jgi:hypothetical protein
MSYYLSKNTDIKIMKKTQEKNFGWSVEQGDYERDEEATITYHKRKDRKRRIRLSIIILIYLSAVTLISYLVLKLF